MRLLLAAARGVPSLTPQLPPFLKGGIFVPAAMFAPFLLAFVPPGTLEQPQRSVEIWVWAVLAVVLAALALLVRVPLLRWAPVAAPLLPCLGYALVGLGPIAFALDTFVRALIGDCGVAVLIGLAFVTVGLVTPPLQDCGAENPWILAAAAGLPCALAVFGLPAFGAVLVLGSKAWLDAAVLRELDQARDYGQYRRWLTVGSVAYGLAFTLGSPEVGSDAVGRGLVSVGACLLFIVLGWVHQQQRSLGEHSLLTGTLTRTSSWGTGQSSFTYLPGHYSVAVVTLAVFTLGVGRGALLPHALSTRLIRGGFPAHVTGLQTLVGAFFEFAALSTPHRYMPGLRLRFCLGLIFTGIHLQVVCALSGSNWLWVLPLSSAIGGVASAFVAAAVPPLADAFGGVYAQGMIQGAEHVGIASSILLVPHVIDATGSGTFVFQIAAYLLIVCGVMFFLERPALKGSDDPSAASQEASQSDASPIGR